MYLIGSPSVLFAQIAFIGLAFCWSSSQHHPGGLTSFGLPNPIAVSLCKALLAIVSVSSVLGTLYWMPLGMAPVPHKPGARIVNMGIWTIHFGIDNEGRDSQRGVAKVITCVHEIFWTRIGEGLTWLSIAI